MECVKCKKTIPDNSAFCMFCGKRVGVAPPKKALKRPNGAGTVYQLSGRRKRPWVAAKNKVILGYFATKTDALDELQRRARVPLNEVFAMTLYQVYESWSREHFPTLTPAGIKNYEASLAHLSDLKGKRMRDIRTSDFQEVIDRLVSAGKSRSTCEKERQLCSQLCKWAMREDILDKNYAAFIRLPKEARTEKSIFTSSEIQKITDAAESSDTARIILILIYTGFRINELFSMSRENVHLEDRYMAGGSKTAAGRDRIVPISNKILKHITYFYENPVGDSGGPESPLLQNGVGKSIDTHNWVARSYYKLLSDLCIERKSPHSARHTFASLMAKAKVAPELLQKIIGHADYSTTANIYVHEDLQQLIDAIDQI